METSIHLGLHSRNYVYISKFHFHFRYHFCLCIAKQTTIKFILDISLNNFSSHCSLWLSNVITTGSDIKFTCGESKRKYFYAHKYVLATSSVVFYAMFYGDLAEKGPTIHLPDTDEESLEVFLRFLYTEDCKMTAEVSSHWSNTLSLQHNRALHVAHKALEASMYRKDYQS